eukprot:scaffold23412_cov81-Phaeocystis_antarctica.AAC.1
MRRLRAAALASYANSELRPQPRLQSVARVAARCTAYVRPRMPGSSGSTPSRQPWRALSAGSSRRCSMAQRCPLSSLSTTDSR